MNGTASDADADVVVVGAGPGGCVLAYLLARSGVETLLLERHADLDREFRGFGFQPDALRLFDEMGLLDRVLELDHAVVDRGVVHVYGEPYELVDFDALPGPYSRPILMEQPPLLELLIEAASAYECFSFRPRTAVRGLRYENGRVVGVEARDRAADDAVAVRSRLVVGADGRYSTVRDAAGVDPGLRTSSVELLWFKLPASVARRPAQGRLDEEGVLLYFGLGGGEVQLGWFIERGSYPALRAAGIEAFRQRLLAVDPSLSAVFPDALPDFDRCSLLEIAPGISDEWVGDGFLLLGDAAHVASPIGAQGNALAIQDAVVAHSTVAAALETDADPLPVERLRPYERRRRPAVERTVRGQRAAERALSAFVRHRDAVPAALLRPALRAPFAALSRLRLAETRPGRRALFGTDPAHVDTSRFEA